MRKVLFSLIAMLCTLSSLYAQQSAHIIRGIVQDAFSGQPLEGATLTLQKSQGTTIANNEGRFSINLPVPSDSLIITCIGYKTQFIVVSQADSALFIIQLKPATAHLHEVVVSTGYQDIPKERATGSFDFIDNDVLNRQVGSNILNRIDGVTNAVLFPKQDLQKGPSFMIRGLSTINGPKDPLIIVDNFPYEGNINNINPNDVESITILKDAAAASIWGTRAGNGVVVITTKTGHLNHPLEVNLNANISIIGAADLSSLRTISSSDYIEVEQMLFSKGYYDTYLNDTRRYPAVSPVIDILDRQKRGQISSAEAASQMNAYRKIDIKKQFEKYMYQQAVSQQYAINLQGGSDNITYYMSMGYDKSIDQLANKNNRLTFKTKNLYKPFKNIKVTLGVQYTQVNNVSGKPPFGSILINNQWQIPYLRFATQSGDPVSIAKNYRKGYTDTAGSSNLLDWSYYPKKDYKHNTTKVLRHGILANIGISYKLLKGLNLNMKYLYEKQHTLSKNHQDIKSYAARDLINRFSQIDRTTGEITYIIPKGGILSRNITDLESQNIRGQIDYSYSWNKNSISAIAGSEIRETTISGNSNIYYGYDDNTDITAGVDFSHTYPTLPSGRNSFIPGSGGLSDKLNRYVSFYGNASYTYDNKYTFSISGRRDASNLFGVSTNNKWNPLWSAGLAWQISNEPFYNVDWLPYLKLRVTDGVSGNTDPSMTGITTLVLSGPIPPSNLPTSRVNQFPNPELRWEKVQMINAGIDFRSKKRILSGSIEFYLKRGTDLYGSAPFDPTAGLNGQSGLVRNVANMKGKGVDISITSNNINKQLTWKTKLLFSYNTNKTTKYYMDSSLKSGSLIGNGYVINPLVGKPLYSIVALPWAGLDESGNPQGYIGKDVSTDYYNIVQNTLKEDLIYKSSLPVTFGSLINTIQWRSFSFTANISYSLGYFFMKPSLSYSTLFGNGAVIGSSDFSERWQKVGDESKTNIPSMIYPANNNRDAFYNHSEALIESAGNMRLKYINISYNIEKAKWNKLPFEKLQIYIVGSNLGILWRANKDGIDPDYISSIHPGKTFSIGIRANF